MKKTFTVLIAAIAAILMMAQPMKVVGQTRTTTYEQLTSIANIDESAQYVLGIDGTGFHYDGTSSWGKTALPSSQTPYYYKLKKHDNGGSFTAYTTISNTNYYLLVPGGNSSGSNTFSMQTSDPTTNDDKGNIIIGTTYVNSTNYAVTSREYTKRHLRNNGTSGLRAYAGNTGDMAYFYKVKYTVNYNCNGGDSGCPTTTINNVPSGNYTLAAAPTRENYTFDGWSDGTNTYDAGATYLLNADNKTFTAQWTLNSSSPTTTVSPTSLSDFSCVQNSGNPSASQSFAVSGANLDANISVLIAENSDFEMSAQDGENWSSTTSITLTKDVNNAVAETNIYVRMKASTTYGDKSGSISITSGSASDKSVSLSGNVIQAKTITWHHGAGGESTATTNTYVGATLAELPTAATVNGWTFIGWAASYTSGYPVTVTAPLTVTAGMGDFFAVYRHGNNVIYQLTTSTSDLSAGTRYMMGYYSSGYLLMTANFAGTSAISLDASNQYTYTAGTQWTLGGSNNAWTFTDANGKLLSSQSTTSSNASLKLETTATDYSYWSISYDDESPKHSKIQNNGNVSNNSKNLKISYYSSTFNCYDNAVVYLFKEVTEYSKEPTVEKCYVTYDGNDATSGDVPEDDNAYDPGDNVTVKDNTGSLAKTGHTWSGWCLNEAGTGTVYGPTYAATYPIPANTTFYAKWSVDSYSYTLTDDSHSLAELKVSGSSYSEETIPYGTEVEVAVDTDEGYGYAISVKDAGNNDITVSADDKFTMPASTVSITVTSYLYPKYTLVTSADQIKPGKHYVFASTGVKDVSGYAMGSNRGNNRSAEPVTPYLENTKTKITINKDIYEFVISGSSLTTEYWTIYDETNSGYVKSTTGNSNNMQVSSSALDDCGKWTITIGASDNVATIKAQGFGNRKYMRLNGTNNPPIFSCYESGKQSDVYLYIKDDDNDGTIYSATTIETDISYTNLTIIKKVVSNNTVVNGIITVPNAKTLTVTGTLTNQGDADNLFINDGGQLISNSVAATVHKTIDAWANNSGWYLLSSPITSATITGDSPTISNLITSSGYDLFRYNESKSTDQWENYKNEAYASDFTSFERGRGYLYRNGATQDVTFTGNTNTSVTYNLSYANEIDALKGFNIIGNPFTHNITWTDITKSNVNPNGYYTLGTDGNWTVHKSDFSTNPIAPMQGFLVQAEDANPSVTFGAAKKNNENKANNDYIKFMVSNSQYNDVTYALFDKGNGINKIDHRNAEIPMLYIPQDGKNYAIATMGDDTQMFNLSFEAKTMGAYTISMNAKGNFSYIHLIDRLTGDDTNLLIEDYSFIGSPQDNAERFIVKLSYDNGSSTDSETFAYQSGNEIIVNGEGTLEVYDVTGRKVMSTNINGIETINGLNSGVYIFRVIGETLRTQKIVVR